MQKIEIPEAVRMILTSLQVNGFEGFAVGGCVRDSIMGRKPKDWDITTSARPEDIKRIFRNTYDTGIEHGTVSVRFGTDTYEVTTYRIDGTYTDHRHPDSVCFSSSLEEDLKRRDFTMNAMAYHPEKGIIDLFGGREDIQNRVIRAVGDPEERFEEDALRMLRAFRFASRFGFSIETKTRQAILKKAASMSRVSVERIREELNQILCSDHPEMIGEILKTDMLKSCLPELYAMVGCRQGTPYHCYSVDVHTYEVCRKIPKDHECVLILRWTALLHDIGKPQCKTTDREGIDHFKGHPQKSAEMAQVILRRLKFDNESRKAITLLTLLHDEDMPEDENRMRHLLSELPDGMYPLLHAIQWADTQAKNPDHLPAREAQLNKAMELYQKVTSEGQCVKLAELAINGKDLIDLGFPKGKRVGEILQVLLEQVLDYPELNKKEILLGIAGQIDKGGAQ